ncbi:hypothetical protein GCM10010885_17840 [Alicyclobacillus cellulosilyticus]|uniref:tRNA (Adenine22-N1)-methyltransferase n=1 Tax=Alicyclobacillus cellulosilyticus TaxID=1003997 RepID=A0A917KDB2_9BACL|nr:hypothetical protein GCM10010885_17840 [Alicyclobacillus cellulosilyticus]
MPAEAGVTEGGIKLSPRLQRVAEFVLTGRPVADVGTDHAFLPIYLVQSGRVPLAIATDIAPGPYRAALANVRKWRLLDAISVRLGPGLTPLYPGEAATVVIAGMGGRTVRDILAAEPAVVAGTSRFIIQPMNAAEQVRRFMYGACWRIVHEEVVAAEGRLYEMVVFDPPSGQGADRAYDPYAADEVWMDLAFIFGPYLLSRPDAQVRSLVAQTAEKWRRICRQLDKAETSGAAAKQQVLADRLRRVAAWQAHAGAGCGRHDGDTRHEEG